MLKITIESEEVNKLVAQFRAVAADAIRPAAHDGARVIFEQAQANVLRRPSFVTGNLYRALYYVFSEDNSNAYRKEYHIGWNIRKAPHGQLVENGYIQKYKVNFNPKTGKFWTDVSQLHPVPKQIPAYPFMRPAADMAMGRAVVAAHEAILQRMAAVGAKP